MLIKVIFVDDRNTDEILLEGYGKNLVPTEENFKKKFKSIEFIPNGIQKDDK